MCFKQKNTPTKIVIIKNTDKIKLKKGLNAKHKSTTKIVSSKFPKTREQTAILFLMFNIAHKMAPEKSPQTGSGEATNNTNTKNSFDDFFCEIKLIGFCKKSSSFFKIFSKNFSFLCFFNEFNVIFDTKNNKSAKIVLAKKAIIPAPKSVSELSPQICDAPSGTAIFVSIPGTQAHTSTTNQTPNLPKNLTIELTIT